MGLGTWGQKGLEGNWGRQATLHGGIKPWQAWGGNYTPFLKGLHNGKWPFARRHQPMGGSAKDPSWKGGFKELPERGKTQSPRTPNGETRVGQTPFRREVFTPRQQRRQALTYEKADKALAPLRGVRRRIPTKHPFQKGGRISTPQGPPRHSGGNPPLKEGRNQGGHPPRGERCIFAATPPAE